MSGKQGLLHGPLGSGCIHICVDMQRLFAAGSPWAVPWLERIEPTVVRLCEHAPAHTVFTRFLPPASPEDAGGAWRRYYRKWQDVTLDRIGRQAADLVPALARFVPPAHVVGKQVYSPWLTPTLDGLLRKIKAHTLLLTGGETDICVLSTALGAIDRGYRVVLIRDALCSSSDRSHDALMDLCLRRFGTQVEVTLAQEVLESWRPG